MPLTTAEAGRALSRKRWGSTRPNRLAQELAERADELDAETRAQLRERLDATEAERQASR